MAGNNDNDVASVREGGSALPGPRLRRGESADIDMTPMIDLTFLMLIFFLVSSIPDEATSIDLPKAQHGVAVSQTNAVIFSLGVAGLQGAPLYAGDGRVPGTELSDDRPTRLEQVRQIVEEAYRENKVNVVIKSDRNVPYREVAQVVKAASSIGGIKIHMAVLEKD